MIRKADSLKMGWRQSVRGPVIGFFGVVGVLVFMESFTVRKRNDVWYQNLLMIHNINKDKLFSGLGGREHEGRATRG